MKRLTPRDGKVPVPARGGCFVFGGNKGIRLR